MSRSCLIGPLLLVTLAGCVGRTEQLPTVAEVDLERFMGDWYVLAHIPAFPERNAKLEGGSIEGIPMRGVPVGVSGSRPERLFR